MKRFELGESVLINSDNLEVLKSLPDNSIDSVVTDPPYGLKFMGKKWDYDVPKIELWEEVYRVLKPGGHILVACGTRTQHRMVVNIEDAGFEIRDVISWVYGSGFPKSLNIGKAIDKIQGNEREIVGTEIIDIGMQSGSMHAGRNSILQLRDKTKGHSPYEGWGTALKPACEFFTLARKPISEKNIAENVLKWGTGGINIDECRVGSEALNNQQKDFAPVHGNKFGNGAYLPNKEEYKTVIGRFPSNFIHDGSDEVVGLFPETKSGGGDKGNRRNGVGFFGNGKAYNSNISTVSQGSAARFFYCAKASPSERNEGLDEFEKINPFDRNSVTKTYEGMGSKSGARQNHHPTVKPIALMEYLIKLITPKGGTVLDPFAGSGTTGIAAINLKVKYILIEREAEYCTIADARLKHFYNKIQPDLFEAVNAF